MSWGAVAVGGAALVGSYVSGQGTARAAQGAADAQADMARRTRGEIIAQGQENQTKATALAEAQPEELAALSRSYSVTSKQLDRQQKLLDAIDPTVMEASKQALQLLRGQSSGLTSALQQQTQLRRTQLINSLRAQFGPNGEESAVGQHLLQQFDTENSIAMQTANQSALQQATGIASHDWAAPQRMNVTSLQQIGQGYGALQERKLNAQVNTGNALTSALGGTSAQMIQAAGAPFVGQGLQAQGLQSAFNNAGSLAMMYGLTRKPGAPGTPPSTPPKSNDFSGNSYFNSGSVA